MLNAMLKLRLLGVPKSHGCVPPAVFWGGSSTDLSSARKVARRHPLSAHSPCRDPPWWAGELEREKRRVSEHAKVSEAAV